MKKFKNVLTTKINIRSSYLLILLLVSIIFTCICFSYALFTSTSIKNNAVSIVTGSLKSMIESEDLDENNSILVGANSTKYFTIKLTNVNNINSKFNLYYSSNDDLTNVSVGYLSSGDKAPSSTGYVLNQYETTNYQKEIIIVAENKSNNNVTLTIGSDAGLENANLALPDNVHTMDKVKQDYLMEEKSIMDGTIVYFNPETGKQCTDYKDANSLNQNKSGCMKWYAFNDSASSDTLNLILDHNTTAKVVWNSADSNLSMNEVKTALDNDKSTWNTSLNTRLITADEVAKIIKKSSYNSSTATDKDITYFDGDGSQQIATTSGESAYDWLFNNTKNCSSYGCSVEDPNTQGYWTSTPVYNTSNYVWDVYFKGQLEYTLTSNNNAFGIRPVITIYKKNISNSLYCNGNLGNENKFNYNGKEQIFQTSCDGIYKIETWGAQGGFDSTSANVNVGGYGGYSIGLMNINSSTKLYINVGGTASTNGLGGYNGGGNAASISAPSFTRYGGGGATHIAKNTGLLSSLKDNIASIIMVSGGGGGSKSTELRRNGGSGGGYIGNDGEESFVTSGKGGTQTLGGAGGTGETDTKYSTYVGENGTFGQGGNGYMHAAGGGGGFYGGGSGTQGVQDGTGGGGSGYIANTLLTDKHMTCYNCETSTEESTKTNSTTNVSSTPISNYAKIGNGYAKITLVSLN